MNIGLIIKKATNELEMSGIKTANLDVILLLEKALKKDRAYILTHDTEPMTNSEYSRFRQLIRRRKKGEPIAYILGHKEFYGCDFFVNKNVLIPRPETELIVENAINYLKSQTSNLKNKEKISIIDIGTGSGCIIISLMKEIKKTIIHNSSFIIHLYASDISKKALYVAKKNARLHKVNNNIRFFYSDLFSNSKMPKKYDLIIANLPYVPDKITNHKSQITKNMNGIYFEPKNAIFANNNGTEIIKKFLKQAKSRINKDGLILIEVDPRNSKELLDYSKKLYQNDKIDLIKDLANIDRVIRILL